MSPDSPPAEAVQDALNRVLASAGFTRNERLSRFLRFVVERQLAGCDSELKESVVGIEVFGRPPGFDPKVDSTVRTEAGKLRSRLLEYYTDEGRQDPLRITLPKGGYIPHYQWLDPARPEAPVDGRRLVWFAAAALAAVGMVIGVWRLTSHGPAPAGSVTRFVLSVPETDTLDEFGLAISPDGRHVVYVARRGGRRQLFHRALDQLEVESVSGTEGGMFPFFSPDGQWIGFFADTALKKVRLAGGTPVTICPAGFRRGASWSPDGQIVFASSTSPDLMQVPAAGGTPRALTALAPHTGKRAAWPEVSADGRLVFYTLMAVGNRDTARIIVRSLDTGAERELVAGTSPYLSPTGHLLFSRPGELWAVPFDRRRLAITGSPVPAVDGVQVNTGGLALYAVARDGSLVHAAPSRSVVVVLDRAGQADILLDVPRVYTGVPEPSPDGHRLVMAFTDRFSSNPAIWTYDLERRQMSRLTFGMGRNSDPLWTPDGHRIVFSSTGSDGARNLFWTAADGSGSPEQLTRGPDGSIADSWTSDGRTLAFEELGQTFSISMLRVNPPGQPQPFLRAPYSVREAAFSPDGRWLAYTSSDTGQDEVYVRTFPAAGGTWQVSARGGNTPRWSADGRELLYYVDDTLMVADVTPGPTFHAAPPRALFRHKLPWNSGTSAFSMMPDGQHVLMLQPAGAPFQLQVTLNWMEGLKARMPMK